MAMTKKSAPKSAKTVATSKLATGKDVAEAKETAALIVTEKSGDELVAENFAALSNVVDTLGTTLELLVQKMESMASHIIATEETLAELVASNGLDLARVNARIRAKIAAGTDNQGSASHAIDVAAAIASPLPRR